MLKLDLELPEIETLRRDCEREFLTRKVKDVEINSMAIFPKNRTKKEVQDLLIGAKVEEVLRIGMYLVFVFDNEKNLVIKMSDEAKLTKNFKEFDGVLKFALHFTQGGPLQLSEPKDSLSELLIVDKEDLKDATYDSDRTGFDIQSQPVSWVDFGRLLSSYKLPLKQFLTDQSIIIGIGDIYSNEILFDSGLRYDRMSNELSTQEVRRLYRAVISVLYEASRAGGTSLPDRPFTSIMGEEGQFASELVVFGRNGELSPRSRLPIEKTRFKNQVVYFCQTQV